MRHWLLRRPPHYTDIRPDFARLPWDYDKVFVDVRLKANDIVYLLAAQGELYGWGYVNKRESYRDDELNRRAYKVTVNRPVVHPELLSAEEAKRAPELAELYTRPEPNLIELTATQVNAFNRLLRSKGVAAPADVDADEPNVEPTPVHSFPRVPLSPEEQLWLETAYERWKAGREVDPTEMLVELWRKLPEDFEYRSIDRRLMNFGTRVTLLGALHVDPSTGFVEEADKVIRHIRELIRKNPGIEQVTAEEISEGTIIQEDRVALVFSFINDLGPFWNGASGIGGRPGYSSVTIKEEHVKRAYLSYKDIGQLLDKFYKDRQPEQTHAKAPLTAEQLEPAQKLGFEDIFSSLGTIEHMTTPTDARNIFVVHGRNLEARNSLFRFLRSIGLRPLEWSQAIQMTGKASPFIGEILDVAFSNAQAVIVLMTPDDVAQLQEQFRNPHDPPYEAQPTGQARPNVLFEAGMAMGRNPERTVLVELGTLRPFSDIAGRHTVRLSNSSTARHELAQRLQTAGCAVDLSGRDWHVEGDFDLGAYPTAPELSRHARGQLDEHDKRLFARFLSAFPSRGKEVRFLRDHDVGVDFPSTMLDPFYDFIERWGNAEHEFNNSELEERRLEFWNTLNTFLRELGQYTSENRGGWLSIGLRDMENRDEMLEAHPRLNDLGTKAYEAHQNLVRAGRRIGISVATE